MNEKQIVREIMKMRGWSQQKLADEAGYKYQTNIASLLSEGAKGMRVDNLLKLLTTMGCELVVRDKMGSKKEWVVDSTSAPAPAPAPTTEELLSTGKITFEEAVARGWKPSKEMLAKMLGGE